MAPSLTSRIYGYNLSNHIQSLIKFSSGVLCLLISALMPLDVVAVPSSPQAETFQINAGLNDAWFNPATDGQGFFITVFPNLGKVSLAWFTYDTVRPVDGVEAHLGEPGHRWLTALGDYQGNQADMIINKTSGGLFDESTPINRRDDGTIKLTFNNCNDGTIEYHIPSINRQGTIPIQRVSTDNVSKCEQENGQASTRRQALNSLPAKPEATPTAAFQINPGLNDAWFNPATDGQGFFITVFPDLGKVSLAWFTYDTVRPADGVEAHVGEPGHRWLTALGDYQDKRADMTINIASGGLFDESTLINRRDDGTITLTFNDCNEGTIEYHIPSINQQGTIPIQRVSTDNVASCELAGAPEPVNSPPVADAGANQIVLGGSIVNLIGERSTDADGAIKSIRWEQLSGPHVSILSSTALNASFVAPDVSGTQDNPDSTTLLRFRLIVWDEESVFDTDSINIIVQPSNLDIQLQRGSGDGSENPKFFLLDQNGEVIDSADGNNASLNINLPAGVYYVFPTADIAVDLDITITASTGLDIDHDVRPADMSGKYSFITTGAFPPANIMPFLVNADFGEETGDRQFIEFTLKDPDPALRDPDEFLQFINQQSLRHHEDAAVAEAYYQAVDPFRDRLSLSDWKFVNGFDDGDLAHVVYQNDADLGFGRDMHARKNDDSTVASYVRNFPSVEHAVADDSLIATVAMEYGPPEGGGEYFTKFFAYGPDGSRILAADLDGRGAKFIPGLCNVCHGGQPKRLVVDDSGEVIYPDDGDTQAQFLPWDLDTFKFAQDDPALTRAAQEPEFKKLNEDIALATYPAIASAGKWTGAVAKDLIRGWYDKGALFDKTYVPVSWAGNEDLYLDVFAPNCRACHINRGTNLQNQVDFGSYDKFIGYAPMIRSLVFDQGVMPLAVRTFGHFWTGGNNSPARQLAEALPDEYELVFEANRSSDAKTLAKPGRPVAHTGMLANPFPSEFFITGKANEEVIDGRASRFPVDQDWQISSTQLDAEIVDQRGDLAVTTQSDIEPQESDRLIRQIAGPGVVQRTRFIRAQLPDNNPWEPRNFVNDIWTLIGDDCVGCHKPGGPFPGIPVFFYADLGTDDADAEFMYLKVLERIDFDDPTNSLILTKPGGLRHGGNTIAGWEYFTPDGEIADSFDRGLDATRLMDWVQAGARYDFNQQVKICRDTGNIIPDNDSTGISDRIFIGPTSKITDFSVQLNLEHEKVSDLIIRLRHTDSGKTVTLLDRQCGNSRDVTGTFDDDGGSTTGICSSTGAANEFRPANPLSTLDGGLVNGFWELEIKDLSPGFTGLLKQWCVINSVPE